MKTFFKNSAKSIGLIVLYILVQGLVVLGVMLFYVKFVDGFWTDLVNAIDNDSASNTVNAASMTVMGRILVPSMLISDLLITIPVVLFSKKKKDKIIKKIQINKFFIIVLLSLGLNIIIDLLLNFVPSDILSSYQKLMSVTDGMSFWQQLIIIGILAPIVEELLFRYAFIRPFRNYKPKLLKCSGVTVGIVLSAISFGIAHGNIVQSSYAFVLGLILGYIYTRDFNLSESILMHITINSSSLILGTLKAPYSYVMMGMMLLSFVVSVFLIVMEKKRCKNKL